jgi:hypothetical protein
MTVGLETSSCTIMLAQNRDFSCAIYDADARQVSMHEREWHPRQPRQSRPSSWRRRSLRWPSRHAARPRHDERPRSSVHLGPAVGVSRLEVPVQLPIDAPSYRQCSVARQDADNGKASSCDGATGRCVGRGPLTPRSRNRARQQAPRQPTNCQARSAPRPSAAAAEHAPTA